MNFCHVFGSFMIVSPKNFSSFSATSPLNQFLQASSAFSIPPLKNFCKNQNKWWSDDVLMSFAVVWKFALCSQCPIFQVFSKNVCSYKTTNLRNFHYLVVLYVSLSVSKTSKDSVKYFYQNSCINSAKFIIVWVSTSFLK